MSRHEVSMTLEPLPARNRTQAWDLAPDLPVTEGMPIVCRFPDNTQIRGRVVSVKRRRDTTELTIDWEGEPP